MNERLADCLQPVIDGGNVMGGRTDRREIYHFFKNNENQ